MLNNCSFIGRLAATPELKYTQSGTPVSSFTIACGEKWKDKQGNQQETVEWVKVVCWSGLAENCSKFLGKGSLVYCSGKMQTRQWEDNDGNKRYTTEIIAREVKFLDSKPSGSGERRMPDEPPVHQGGTGDDVPF